MFFIVGLIFGSFYNVVGYRLPKGESLIRPPSHCTNCNKRLTPIELIPLVSFFIQGGMCKHCKAKISFFYPLFEFFTGLLFMLSFIIFGFSLKCLLSIVFVSMLLIIIISDYQTMIIPDSVLIVFSILILVIKYFDSGINGIGICIINGILSFIFMLSLKLFGDFLFNKESMGGGDIKLLGVFGITFGFPLSVISVFLAAIIGFPISLIILKSQKTHEIPFGPFLAVSAIIIMFLNVDFMKILNILTI